MLSATDAADITIDWIKPGGPQQVWVPMLHSPGSGLIWPLIAAGAVLAIAAIYLVTLGASARLRWRLAGGVLTVRFQKKHPTIDVHADVQDLPHRPD